MQAQPLRTSINLTGQFSGSIGRRTAFDLFKQPGLRPLHASPIFQRPRRRDFFSSNAALHNQKASPEATQDGSKGSAQTQNRKTSRPSGAKTSLRRVAVEAQRSKDGKLSHPSPQCEDTPSPKAVTAYAVAETFDITKVVEILRSKGYEPDPLGTGAIPASCTRPDSHFFGLPFLKGLNRRARSL